MKNTPENVVKVLKAMKENTKAREASAERLGNKARRDVCTGEINAYDRAIWLLTDGEYFDEMAKIFANRIAEQNGGKEN